MKKVLVLDADQRSALAVTRSLGKQHVQLFTAEEKTSALAGCSKFSLQYFTYPSPRLNPEQFIDFLVNLVKEQNIDMLLPMTELTTMLLLMHQGSFPDTCIPFPVLNTVESLADKCLLMKTAESLNVPIPKTWHASNCDNLPCKLEDLPYPIVLKPGKSWLFNEGQWSRAGVRFAEGPDEAKSILDSYWAFKAHPFLIQENIAGHGAGVFAIYDNGKPLALFAHRRLREKPPRGGVSVLSESIRVRPALALHAKKLLENANWHGVAMVEFRVTPEGKPYLMEINTRFWGSLQLAIDSGVDFPWLLYQTCNRDDSQASSSHQIPVVSDYKIGQRLRWILGDLDSLYLVLRDKDFSLKEKVNAIINFLTPHPFITLHEVNRLSDFKPFLWELKQYIKDLRG